MKISEGQGLGQKLFGRHKLWNGLWINLTLLNQGLLYMIMALFTWIKMIKMKQNAKFKAQVVPDLSKIVSSSLRNPIELGSILWNEPG